MYILCLRGSYEVILEVLLLLGQYGSFNKTNSLLISKRLGGMMQSSSGACVLFHFAHSFWLCYLWKLKVNLVCRINIFYLLNPEDIRSALLRYPLLVSILFLSDLTTNMVLVLRLFGTPWSWLYHCYGISWWKGTLVNCFHTEAGIQRCSLKRCSENMQQIYRRTPMSNCDFTFHFIEITLRDGCSPVNLLHIFRTPFSKNTSRRLLLFHILI